MKKRLTMILAGLFLTFGMAMAQTKVTGTVVDEYNDPIMGATVKVVGTSAAALTDIDGNFSIQAPSENSRLQISYVGYVTQTVKAGRNIRVILESDVEMLEDVVVVGYGSARKVGSITGQVTTVNSEKLKNAPSASALDALQGQVAGMSVLSTSGVAGDNAVSIKIHGTGSLGASSTPLYVLDGIPVSSNTIYMMNPNDIQSVTVLKDASATSIYGARAANGVVYVTSKGGSFNSKATVTFRTQYGWSTLADKSLYKNMMSSQELYDFWVDGDIWWGLGGRTGQDAVDYAIQRYGLDVNANTKWYNYLQQFNNPQTQNDLTIEGGSERVSYLISGSQFHQRGNTIGNYYDRYTVRSNINAKPKDWLRVGMNTNLSYDRTQRNANWGDSSGASNYVVGGLSYLINPMIPAVDEYGNEFPFYYDDPFLGQYSNQHYYSAKVPRETQTYLWNVNAFGEITLAKGLKWTTRVGTDAYISRYTGTVYPSYMFASQGQRARSNGYNYSNTMTNTLEYSFDLFEDHHFTFLAGHEGVKNHYDTFSASSSGQFNDAMVNLQDGLQKNYSVSESASDSRFLSFFGRVNYNLLDRYFVDLSIRNDRSSRFGKNKRDATFWAAGFLWKVKNEPFMKDVNWVNELDFKASYGTQGNAGIGNYASLGLVSRRTNYNDEWAWYYTQPYNYNLAWEKQGLFSVGLSGKLFKFLDFDVSYYIRNTKNMLMDAPYPYSTGFPELTQNVGELQNRGIDFKVGFDILRGKDHYLRFSLNGNYNSEKVKALAEGRQRWEMNSALTAYVVGKPVMFYLPIWAGVDPETGEPQWFAAGENKDVTNKTVITKEYDEEYLIQNSGKRVNAPFNGGFSLSGGYKGFSFAADFVVVLGKYMVNNDAYFYANPVNFYYMNQHKDVRDFWTEEHTNAKYPDWREGYIMQFDTHLLENASFLRLKNLQIGYDIPRSVIGFQDVVKNIKLTFTGRNLFTITDYSGIDPEVPQNLTYGIAGNSKQYIFGLEVTF